MNSAFIDQSTTLPFAKVTPIRLPRIIDMANNFWKQETLPYNLSFSDEKLNELENNFRTWFDPLISLNDFQNMYFLNHGISQGLDFLGHYHNQEKIRMILGDYHWLKTLGCADEEKNKIPCNISYQSNPSSIDGNIVNDHWDSEIHILDGAYIGSCTEKIIIPQNTKYVLLSFSKNLGLLELRSGLLLSKEKLPVLDIFQKKFLHLGLHQFNIISKICNEVNILEHAKELKFYQEKFCSTFQDLNLTPSKSALIATTNDIRFKFYRRRNGIIRVPLGESITKWINQ